MKTRALHRSWVTVQFITMAAQLASVIWWRSQWAPVTSVTGGALLVAVGAALGISGTRALGRNRTLNPMPKADGELITSGIYARVRHPLYASVSLLGIGWALIWRSTPSLLLAIAQTGFLRAKASLEERLLRERFPSYGTYARQVPAFFPRLLSRSEKLKP